MGGMGLSLEKQYGTEFFNNSQPVDLLLGFLRVRNLDAVPDQAHIFTPTIR